MIKVNRTGAAVYKGQAMGQITGGNVLYAANFFGTAVEVFDKNFNALTLNPHAFRDAAVPAGYGPFNVQNINGTIYVTWAKQDAAKKDDVPGAGFGYVSAFTQTGTLVSRLQFGNGTVAAFDPGTGQARGLMKKTTGQTLSIPGLWGLSFGNGGSAGPTNSLYFAAGIAAEAHGLFGTLTAQ